MPRDGGLNGGLNDIRIRDVGYSGCVGSALRYRTIQGRLIPA
jgi:hypothetical protein